jgi:hypothetical protein
MANEVITDLKLRFLEDDTANELATGGTTHAHSRLVKLPVSGVPMTKMYAQQLALSAGAYTLNLTALTDAAGAAMTFLGLKTQFVYIENAPKSGAPNTGTLNIKIGASDGYAIFGDAASEVTLAVGGYIAIYNPEGCPDVASDVDQIDISSSDADADFIVMIGAG